MAELPTNIVKGGRSRQQHVDDHNELHRLHDILDGSTVPSTGGGGGGGDTDWGDIGGTLADQTDLAAALVAKAATAALATEVTTARAAEDSKLALAGGTLTGPLVLPGNAATALQATPLQQVQSLIAALVNSAPGTLDTLVELASALGNDPNLATTLTTLIGTKETPAGAQAKVDAMQAQAMTVVVFTNPATARPTGWAGVVWIGPSEPTNAQDTDLYIEFVASSSTVTGSQATETDTAIAGTASSGGGTVVGSQATETDTAIAGTASSGGGTPVTPSNLTTSGSDTDASVYTTASVTIPGGQASVICVTSTGGASTAAPAVTQTGVTWDLVASNNASQTMQHVFVCAPGSNQTGVITITFGETKTSCEWSVVTCAGSKTGTNGADALGTAVTASQASGTSISVTLSAMTNAASAALGFMYNAALVTETVGSGFTQLGRHQGSNPSRTTASEWKQNTTTVNYTTISSTTARLMGIEVKAA